MGFFFLVPPQEVCATLKRPDIVIWSGKLQKVLLIKLTCPSEENIKVAQLRKQTCYLQQMDQITSITDWSPSLFTNEVGALGFVRNELSLDLAFQGVFAKKFANVFPLLQRDAPLQYIHSTHPRSYTYP